MASNGSTLPGDIGRGVAAGIAGTAVMTAFQKFVEMPLTGRGDSYAPANFAQKVLPIKPKGKQERKRLNYIAHFGLGAMWGSAYGVAAHRGLRGQKAIAAVFGTVYPGDVLLNTALGLYRPTSWTKQDTLIDVGEKLIQAEATGIIFDRFFTPASQRTSS
jgi:hypothetical protein